MTRMIRCEATGPVELAPQDQACLLQHLFGVGPIRQQRQDVGVERLLGAHKLHHKLLTAIGLRIVRIHRVSASRPICGRQPPLPQLSNVQPVGKPPKES